MCFLINQKYNVYNEVRIEGLLKFITMNLKRLLKLVLSQMQCTFPIIIKTVFKMSKIDFI